MSKILIYDTTLRDGAQGEGISFFLPAKIRIARALNEFKIDYIEGGFAASNPKDMEFFQEMKKEKLSHARLVAFGSTRRARFTAAKDPGLAALLEAGTPAVTIFGKSWPLHVEQVLKTTLPINLDMIYDSVQFLKKAGKEVIYDAEHFFDGYAEDADYTLQTLQAAADAGADALVLCDTNGGTLTSTVTAITKLIVERFPKMRVGIHTHNDADLAVANSLVAVECGATMVQGTINGYGERTGNANLCSIIPALALKMNHKLSCGVRLHKLRRISQLVDDVANQNPVKNQPYVGASAFAHKAGMHVDGVSKLTSSFEHIPPESVGNERRILISELSGASNVRLKTDEMGLSFQKDSPAVKDILARLENMEKNGYAFESADASFKLLVQKVLKKHTPYFELLGFNVAVQKKDVSSKAMTLATIKISVKGQTELAAGEGAGPVDALNSALRTVLRRFYPSIDSVTLQDYNVRILNPETATRATTRVLIESSDGSNRWGTVGVSENIIEASWEALLDSVEYKLLLDEQKKRRSSAGKKARPVAEKKTRSAAEKEKE